MKRLLFAVFLSSLVAGCATTIQARSDYDRAQNFSRYRTFAWMDDDPMIAARGERDRVSPLNRRRIVEAVEAELGAKGFRKTADRAAADFVVSYTVGARDRIDVLSYPEPYRGAWGWGRPYFGSRVDVGTYTEGVLAIDVFDGAARVPVWHGWATKRITPHDVEHAAEQIRTAAGMILKTFPPA